MLPTRSSTLSGHIKLWFLILAVLVVLAQTSPDGWLKTCFFGRGKCKRECAASEKKKETCGKHTFCCVPEAKSKLSSLSIRNEWEKHDQDPRRRSNARKTVIKIYTDMPLGGSSGQTVARG